MIISVGGNDIASGTNAKYVEEKYYQMIQCIKRVNQDCNIVICTPSPRQDCKVSELKGILKSLNDDYITDFIDMEERFCSQDGIPNLRYYGRGKIHLSNAGI